MEYAIKMYTSPTLHNRHAPSCSRVPGDSLGQGLRSPKAGEAAAAAEADPRGLCSSWVSVRQVRVPWLPARTEPAGAAFPGGESVPDAFQTYVFLSFSHFLYYLELLDCRRIFEPTPHPRVYEQTRHPENNPFWDNPSLMLQKQSFKTK